MAISKGPAADDEVDTIETVPQGETENRNGWMTSEMTCYELARKGS